MTCLPWLDTLTTGIPQPNQILEIADRLHVETIALQDSKLCKQRLLNAEGYNIVRRDTASAHFWLNGYVNKQNCRIWSEASPQVYVETPLHPEKLTVWCALWAGGIIGPYFFKNDEGHKELWFQQDGATCHTARTTIDLLKDTFGDRLISRFGPVNWPPRSCDLTPLDYFLWGYVKSLVYADKPQTLDHLEDNIRRVIADIRPQMLENVIENWTSRLDYIRASGSSPMPENIFKISWRILDSNGSDPLPILVEIDLNVNCTGVRNFHWNFKKADWSLFENISNDLIAQEPISDNLEDECDNGHVSVDAREAAETIASHYANESRLAFSSFDTHLARVTGDQIKSRRDRPADDPLFNVDFTLPELSYALQHLDINKLPVPDSIPEHFLSYLGILGRERLLYISNMSWQTGKLTRQWKPAIVIPIHKPNKKAVLGQNTVLFLFFASLTN
ncbi:transposable element Tc3 transposase [Trichonephila clavipes]|nr:transposable element Tc3 transposase [Trichonephila clavipes]